MKVLIGAAINDRIFGSWKLKMLKVQAVERRRKQDEKLWLITPAMVPICVKEQSDRSE